MLMLENTERATEESGGQNTITERPTVVSRELLMSSTGPYQIRVPKMVNKRSFVGDDGNVVSYFEIYRNVGGGDVLAFVHGQIEKLATHIGRTIKVKIEVWQKTLSDGRSYLYLDLYPVDSTLEVTHRLHVATKSACKQAKKGWPVFDTPPPLDGRIMLELLEPVERKEAKPSTGDPMLDRLLEQGWKIERDNGTTVSLSKMKDGVPRTMEHHRPKKKVRGR